MGVVWRVVAVLGVLAGVATLVLLLPLVADRSPAAGFAVLLVVFLVFTYATVFALRAAGAADRQARSRRRSPD